MNPFYINSFRLTTKNKSFATMHPDLKSANNKRKKYFLNSYQIEYIQNKINQIF